jgi:diadenosine tetraphosphate (Ap4A) HIT family hydrolase
MTADCVICRGSDGDAELDRVEVWDDDRWRLTMSLDTYTPGFSYLEPKRHIPHITDLDGEEARTFGVVLATVSSVLQQLTGSEVVYLYVFGDGVPHLHAHLAPHRKGDALNSSMIRGELEETPLPSGATALVSREFEPLSRADSVALATQVRTALLASSAGKRSSTPRD